MGFIRYRDNRRLYRLEGRDIFKKIPISFAHLPTMMLVIGYPVYWIELYCFDTQNGQTSWLATLLFLLLSWFVIAGGLKDVARGIKKAGAQFLRCPLTAKFFLILGGGVSLGILFVAFRAALLPPHLLQEFDALHYHITLPRQHLILNSFAHIPWAADDLFLLPINFALAPFWLVTELPNKLPQLAFLLGLIVLPVRILKFFGKSGLLVRGLVIFAVLGSHHVGIQMGTAMLDLVICYLFLAALDSFLEGRMGLFLIESSFFFWSKSFTPAHMVAIVLLFFILFKIFKKWGLRYVRLGLEEGGEFCSALKRAYSRRMVKMIAGFLFLSVLIAGPFLVKSFYYAGTPLFPFAPGALMINKDIAQDSTNWRSLEASSEKFLNHVKDSYGHGRSFSAFVKHLWLIAVPEEGVNNSYDYPLGLVYLLVLGPFLSLFFASLKKREFAIIPFFIILFWGLWWFGSQQSRYLYVPVFLMIIYVITKMPKPSKIFMAAIMVALSLNMLSIYRAHKRDFGLSAQEVLRSRDKEILTMNKDYFNQGRTDKVKLEFHDVAFAQFPVTVTKERLPHTLAL